MSESEIRSTYLAPESSVPSSLNHTVLLSSRIQLATQRSIKSTFPLWTQIQIGRTLSACHSNVSVSRRARLTDKLK